MPPWIRHKCVAVFLALVAPGLAACGDSTPDPDDPVQDLRTSSCERCHQPMVTTGAKKGHAVGILDPHPGKALSCESCHGGNPGAESAALAHVPRPPGIESANAMRKLSSGELDDIPLEYMRWVNPSDYRVAQISCGAPECHQSIVATAASSIMTTFAGHFNKTRYYAGGQSTRQALLGARDQWATVPADVPGSVEAHTRLSSSALDQYSTLPDYLDHYLETSCPRCHVWNFGPNDLRGDFRSSGCAGCHMHYDNDGRSQSLDPNADIDDPAHPVQHLLTTSIPDEQCEHCHYRGNRIGTMYRGVREAARFDDSPFVTGIPSSLHGHPAGFFIADEDNRNQIDETPPDLHQSAGMGCVDCHMGVDVHGDGRLYGAHDYQVGIECEDCHGTTDRAIAPDASGSYRNTRGDSMKMLYRAPDGTPKLTGRLDGRSHDLTQLANLQLDPSRPELAYAHGRDANGFSHTDSLECYACHSSWTQSCFGCHVTIDLRSEKSSLLDGSMLARTGGERSYVTTDYFALGVGTDGKLTPMAPQEKMFVTVIVPCDPAIETCTEGAQTPRPGKRLYDQQVRITHDGKLGMGFGPVVPHTTSSTVQPCDRCHLRQDESNWNIVNETTGRGSGRFVIPDGDGKLYDLTRVVDEFGQTEVGLAHEGTNVLPPAVVQRMLKPRVPNSGLSLKAVAPWKPL